MTNWVRITNGLQKDRSGAKCLTTSFEICCKEVVSKQKLKKCFSKSQTALCVLVFFNIAQFFAKVNKSGPILHCGWMEK